jgi:hypothetical protein
LCVNIVRSRYQRVLVCSSYFTYHGGYDQLEAFEVTLPNGDNPMFVVQARKKMEAGRSKL